MADDNDSGWYRADREKKKLEKELEWVTEALRRIAASPSDEIQKGLHPSVSGYYPNLEAILNGTISGFFKDWPAVRPELIKLFKEVKQFRVEIDRSMEVRRSLRAELDHSRAGAMEERRRLQSVNDRLEGQVEAANRNSGNWCKKVSDLEKDNEVLRQGVEFVNPGDGVSNCKCIVCICPPNAKDRCQGCGAWMCDAHTLVNRAKGPSSATKHPLDPE